MIIAIRKSTFDGATAQQKKVMEMVCEHLDLGDPVIATNPSSIQFYGFDDHRISFMDIAILSRTAALLASLPASIQTKDDLRAAIAGSLVDPSTIDLSGANPQQAVLTANNAPAFIVAASSLPANWTVL